MKKKIIFSEMEFRMTQTDKYSPDLFSGGNRRRPLGKLLVSVAVPLLLMACSNNQGAESRSKTLEVVKEEASGTQSSFLALANEMVEQGDHNAAIPLFRRAIKWHPFASEPLVGLGDSLREVGQYQEAEKAYQSALSRNEQNIQALIGLGKTYIALDRPTMAVPILHDAAKLNPRNVEVIGNLALVLELQGNSAAALKVYKDGLSIEPDNLKLLNNYGLSLALKSRHDQAIEILKQAAQHKDAGAVHRQNLAMAYALSGNEMMSSRLLSIDNGPDLTDENLNYFRILANLPVDERFDAVIHQSTSPRTDTAEPANDVYEDQSRTRNVTVARLVEVPPEPMAVVEPEPEPEPEPEEEENIPPLLGPQGWALQIAAYRSKSDLMPGWEKLKEKYFDIIGHLEPRRSEIDLGEPKSDHRAPYGFYYRLNAGPLTSLQEAEEACRKILERGTDCWVRVPEEPEGKVSEEDSAKAREFRKHVYSQEEGILPEESQ